jgi:WD40 repeat protein
MFLVPWREPARTIAFTACARPNEVLLMTVARPLVLAALLAAFGLSPLAANEPPGQKPKEPSVVSYARDVRPILQQNCQGCHQPARAQGGYVMTTFADLLKPGNSMEPSVVVGQPDKSSIFTQITPQNGKPPVMPKNKKPLLDHEVALIKKWILQGAKDDTPVAERQLVDMHHPPVYALPPVLTSVQYSPDGTLLAVSGYHEVLLHHADGSGLAGRLVGLSERIQSVAFSPDGKLLAVAGGSPGRFGEIQVWDVAAKKLKLSHAVTYDTLYGVSWSHDGSKIAFGCGDNTLRAIEAATGNQILFQGAHSDWVLGTVFSRDSLHLVSISRDRSMKLTEVATQRFIDNVTSITPGALKGGLLTVALRPLKDKTMVKGGVGADSREKLYDELLIGGSDGVPRLYKMHRVTKRVIGDDANKIREYEALPGRVFAACFSPDGNLFAAGSSLNGTGEVRVYQVNDGKRVAAFEGQHGAVYSLAFAPDGKQVASAGFDGVVRLNDPLTGKLIKEFVPVPLSAPGVASTQTK